MRSRQTSFGRAVRFCRCRGSSGDHFRSQPHPDGSDQSVPVPGLRELRPRRSRPLVAGLPAYRLRCSIGYTSSNWHVLTLAVITITI